MKKEIPVHKNNIYELDITSISSEGNGVGHIDGYTVFVPGALSGEKVQALIIKINPGFAISKLQEILVPSPNRIESPCDVFSRCGGCSFLNLDYPSQLKLKQQIVSDALERLGGFKDVAVSPVLGMDNPWRYRNKGAFPFGLDANGKVCFGFFAPKSHRLIPISDCSIQDEDIIRTANLVRDWANACHVTVYDEATQKGCLRHLVVRKSSEGQLMAVIVTKGSLPFEEELKNALSHVDSVWHNRNDLNSNVIFGNDFRFLSGSRTISHMLCGLQFEVAPQSFLQVNLSQTEVLYTEAIRLLNPKNNERILDGYCGIGTMSLLAARHAASVTGVEIVPEAIEDAKQNAKKNRISNAKFVCSPLEGYIESHIQQFDSILLDPPRKGCDFSVLKAIMDSGISNVVYVSCNPATLARDLQILSRKYSLQKVQPVDMFPHTIHCESVCLLSKVNTQDGSTR